MASKLSTAFNCFIVVSLLIIAGCSTDNSSGTDTPVDDNQISFSIRFEENSAFASVAKSAEAVVSADDFEDIVSKLTIGTNTMTGGIKEVPAGKDRYIQVNVYDENDKLYYLGKTVVEVVADEMITASIDLYKVDETGTIIIEGVVIDNNNTDYFTEEELNAIVNKMADKAKVDDEKVVAVLKKGGKFYETKWKKSQLAEVEKLIAAAIKEVSGGNNTDYFTVDELCKLVKALAVKAKKDVDDVFAILKKEGKLFETKWKYEQEEEVIKIIEEAVKKAKDATSTGEYFTVKELCAMVEKMAAEAKKDVDDVYSILKKEGKLFETKWKYEQEEEVIKIIEDAVEKAKDATNTGEYFTVKELCAMVEKMAAEAKKDLDDVYTILKKESKLFETKWKYEQKEEVIKIIAEAVKKAKDATNTDEYFTEDELNAMVKKMAAEANVDVEKVIAVLKKGGKFYETKWKKEQEKEVVALIGAAIKEIS